MSIKEQILEDGWYKTASELDMRRALYQVEVDALNNLAKKMRIGVEVIVKEVHDKAFTESGK